MVKGLGRGTYGLGLEGPGLGLGLEILALTTSLPGLVALYDIRPGNGAGQFLQPRSPHGA